LREIRGGKAFFSGTPQGSDHQNNHEATQRNTLLVCLGGILGNNLLVMSKDINVSKMSPPSDVVRKKEGRTDPFFNLAANPFTTGVHIPLT